MIEFITSIIAVLTIFAGLSGIFAISESIASNEHSSETKEERSIEINSDESEIAFVQDYSTSLDKVRSSLSDIHGSTSTVLIPKSENYNVNLYSDQSAQLSALYLQSTVNSYVEGERAPPALT
ncbi:MAG: hypothetical protein WC693_06420 [Patescibacteria group bacterium]|jgi:hypothetical protein